MEAGKLTLIKLDDLTLDINNPRLAELPKSSRFERSIITLLSATSHDLRKSILMNGFRDNQDYIVVKREGGENIVVEGNRRIAILKSLAVANEVGFNLSQDVEVLFFEDMSDREYFTRVGIAHVAGKKAWSTLAQAKFLKDFIESKNMTQKKASEKLGIPPNKVSKLLKALATHAFIEEELEVPLDFAKVFKLLPNVINSVGIVFESKRRGLIEVNLDASLAGNLTDIRTICSKLSEAPLELFTAKQLGTVLQIPELTKLLSEGGFQSALDHIKLSMDVYLDDFTTNVGYLLNKVQQLKLTQRSHNTQAKLIKLTQVLSELNFEITRNLHNYNSQ